MHRERDGQEDRQPKDLVQMLRKPDPLRRWDFLFKNFRLFTMHHERLRRKQNGTPEGQRQQPNGPDQALGSANYAESIQGSGGGRDQ